MSKNVTQKLIATHLVEGRMEAGQEIGLKIDQTLTQDATGTMVMLELEAMGLSRVKTELSAQYVDHNLLQTDFKNADDHLFLRSACKRFGIWFSRPGNGVSHPVHMERFGIPGKTLLGADSHTCAAGSLGMLAIGAGGLEVALAMAGEPFYVRMPRIWGLKLIGKLPDWVSAKDVILELLRRHRVDGGLGKIIEYYGMGQAPATGRISLRTVPRNFPGRSGTKEDQVYLCSPETAVASALTGRITDPRRLGMAYPKFKEPETLILNVDMLVQPPEDGGSVALEKGPNIAPLPRYDPLPATIEGPVLLRVGDNISTDEIMPAGEQVLPYRSNIPAISKFVFAQVDNTYHDRALQYVRSGSFIVGGRNYGQGSSREHAAIAPRYLGVKAVIAKSFARIH